jgi:AraC-like DNA-binding protein
MVIFLYLLLYQYFEQYSLKNNAEKSIESLHNISENMQFMNEAVVRSGAGLNLENAVQALIYGEPDIWEIWEGRGRLFVTRVSSPYLESIYVYNKNAQKIYCASSGDVLSGVFSRENFYDQEIFKILEENIYKSGDFVPRKIPGTSMKNSEKAVYSYFISNDYKNYVIVLNVLISNTTDLLREPDCETLFVDEKGCLLNYCQIAPVLSDVSEVDFVARVLDKDENEGYFIDTTDGKHLITFIKLPETKTSYIRVFPYDQINGTLIKLRNISILITMSVLLTGTMIAVFLTRKIYKPIKIMSETLNKMKSESRENKYKNRQSVLQLLFDSSEKGQKHLKEKMEKYDIRLKIQGSFVLVAMKNDDYDTFCKNNSLEEREALCFAIANIIHEVAGWEYENETIEMSGNSILLLINFPENDFETEEIRIKRICSLCRKIQGKVEEYMDISLSCIFSNVGSFQQLPLLYQDIINVERYRLYYGKGCIVSTADIIEKKRQNYVYSVEKESELVNVLNKGEFEEVKVRYLEIVNSLYFYPPSIFYANILRLWGAIDEATSFWEYKDREKDICNEMAGKLVRCEDINGINQIFFDFFDMIIKKQKNWRESKHTLLLDRINLIITQESSNKNLSLDMIADRLNMSTDYVGKLFKKYTGKSIVVRINEERIENAKKLLVETKLSINEIIDQVGFSTDKYFFSLFKKMNGLTPNEYRKKNIYEK